MLNENDIIEILVEYLKLNGYSNVKGLTTSQRGVDITAVNGDGHGVCIEAKGETSSKSTTYRYGKPFTRNQIASHVGGAILKTVIAMNEPRYKNYEFGIAFPMNHEVLIRRILPSLKVLDIKVYLVSIERVIIL